MSKFETSNFEIFDELGRGAEGIVYKALMKSTNQAVAIKIVKLEKNKKINNVSKLIDQVNKELEILSLFDHPNIIGYYGTLFNKKEVWLISELCEMGSLSNIINEYFINGLENEILTSVIIKYILEGLKYIHNSGYIHRDIKGKNILLKRNGEIKICDFGISNIRAIGARGKRYTFAGTLCWMAPEFFSDNSHNEKVDIWSLGITAMELGFGRAPYYEYSVTKIMNLLKNAKIPSCKDYEEIENCTIKFSQNYYNFLKKCFEKDPLKRASALELLNHEFILQAKNYDHTYIYENLIKIIE